MKKEQYSIEPFLDLSAILTGFERVDLLGTGMVDIYYDEVVNVVGKATSRELWETTAQIIERSGKDGRKFETAIRREILASAKFGPIARNIIQMWYTGIWNELPQSWRDLYGTSPDDTTRIISSEAYQQGLVWEVIEAHPPAAKQPGFASWSYRPSGDKH
ncbi:MAG: hypothetical protein L0229_20145 [Blastocatellia bacterium]|nr:hypothetical protein [Blastocatellia bacterium]